MGNTGACLATATLVLGRLEGVQRPAIAVPIPHATGTVTVIDAGANVDCRPSHLAQFAVMGEVYSELIHGVLRPRIGLLNVGEEEGKGGEVVQEAHELLRGTRLNYVGNIEGRDVVNGRVDVVVCDGFVGNIVLKFAEGMADAIKQMIRDAYLKTGVLGKLGAFLSRPAFRLLKDRLDPAYYGGAPLLGVNGVCIVGHGASSPKAIKNAVGVARRFVELRANALIRERLHAARLAR
jgi:glycerol-3-phosphate acyltransferase PlsX